jgi:hypothetical protein
VTTVSLKTVRAHAAAFAGFVNPHERAGSLFIHLALIGAALAIDIPRCGELK